MITHENLVDAVYRSNGAWSCPNGDENCLTDYDCMECTEWLVTEYENALREEGEQMALAEALKPYDVEDIEDLIRNVRNKTIAPFEREIAQLNRVDWTEQNLAIFAMNISEIIEQMKEGGENANQ